MIEVRQPVLFVDVDGVLAIGRKVTQARPVGFRADGTAYRRPPRHVGYARRFDPGAIAALNGLTTGVDAALVMSSSWRTKPDARALLIAAGVVDRWHVDWSTDEGDGGRGAQIARWLNDHGSPAYVIFDDWTGELGNHARHVVSVSFKTGLTSDHVATARTILASTCATNNPTSITHDCYSGVVE